MPEYTDIAPYFAQGYIGTCLESGAADGHFLSTTLALEQQGWTCLCIEANFNYFQTLVTRRQLCQHYALGAENLDDQPFFVYFEGGTGEAGVSSLNPAYLLGNFGMFQFVREERVNIRTLDFCLQEAGFTTLGFLSLDLEGGELNALKGCSLGTLWNPRLVIVENHFAEEAIREQPLSCGYVLHQRLGIDDYYIRSE